MRNCKIRFLLRIAIFCLCISFCEKKLEEVSVETKSKINGDLLDQNLLVNSKWGSNPYYYGLGDTVQFSKDFTYHVFRTFGGCEDGYWKGEYAILSSREILFKKAKLQRGGCWDEIEDTEFKCIYKKNQELILIEYYLDCDKFNYKNLSTRIPYGLEKTFRDNLVVSLSGKEAVTTDNVRLRAKPDIAARIYNCTNTGGIETFSFVPDRTRIYLLFRTRAKFKVDKWENYWYYAYPDYSGYGSCDSPDNQGWVFGEFVKTQSDEAYPK